jgi:hypothetical protein
MEVSMGTTHGAEQLDLTVLPRAYFKSGSVPSRCTLGSAVLYEFSLRNGSI